jgi:hypothetical protein
MKGILCAMFENFMAVIFHDYRFLVSEAVCFGINLPAFQRTSLPLCAG